jgi:hypothetical protein
MNYNGEENTYILLFQIWSEKINLTSNYGNIINRIKDFIVKNSYTYDIEYNNNKRSYCLSWKKIKWNKIYNNLYNSDLILTTEYDESIIYEHTKKLIDDIENIFLKDKLDTSYKIIFSIIKPIDQSMIYNNIDNVNNIIEGNIVKNVEKNILKNNLITEILL